MSSPILHQIFAGCLILCFCCQESSSSTGFQSSSSTDAAEAKPVRTPLQCNATHLPLDKMAAILQMTFSIVFSWMKILYFDSNFTEVCSQGSSWHYYSIGSGNGLAPNRQQAITWTNVDPVHGCLYAALGGDELNTALSSKNVHISIM